MKKILALGLSAVLALGLLAGCAPKENPPAEGGDHDAPSVIRVAATPVPHAEVLGIVKEVLAEKNITLEIVEMNDYKQPNYATDSGEVTANYFQHIAYLDQFNKDEGTKLVNVAEIHYEPYGLYPGKTASIDALPDGARIAITNDPSNQARALRLLEAQGLIKLKEDAGLEATPFDVVENAKNIAFVEMEAAQMPAALSSVDMAVINGNYAVGAGLNVTKDAIAVESVEDSEQAALYANVLAVKEGMEQDPAVLALIEALKSDAVRDFINSSYEGAVMPVF